MGKMCRDNLGRNGDTHTNIFTIFNNVYFRIKFSDPLNCFTATLIKRKIFGNDVSVTTISFGKLYV
jgi:hypothetical protein